MSSSIVVQSLGKRFSINGRRQPQTIMESVLSGWRYSKPKQDFWALQDVSFAVSPGEMLGIVGKNGAGKSTLLQLVAQVILPDTGFVKVQGKIGSLLDLGASLSADLTGYENIFINGMIAGLTRKQVSRIVEDVVDFSELQQFIDNPVRTYSSGMKMRLAFAIAIHTVPEVLLIDEFLSVGDTRFREKCQQRIAELRQLGCAIVLVSHNAYQVKKICSKALWLSNGRMQDYGPPSDVVNRYLEATQGIATHRDHPQSKTALLLGRRAHSNNHNGEPDAAVPTSLGDVKITRVVLSPSGTLETGDNLTIAIHYEAAVPVERPIFSVAIATTENKICFSSNTKKMDATPTIITGEGAISLCFERLDLAAGQYFIHVGIYGEDWACTYDFRWRETSLQIYSDTKANGFFSPPVTWTATSNLKALSQEQDAR
ncbi:MAG: ABC transporter ATP-binding protein [Cyanobacteria bacterium J06623_4]